MNGGLYQYEPFYTDEYTQKHGDHKQDVGLLSSGIVLLLDLLYEGLVLARDVIPYCNSTQGLEGLVDANIDGYLDLVF